jgi:ribonuclease VapC
MIVDTSAIVAILADEPEAEGFRQLIATHAVRMSAGTYIEAGIVVDRLRMPGKSRLFDRFLDEARIGIEPVTAGQAKIAREAYRDFGKGSGHRAQLNFGDCFSYALAVDLREPLLFKGDDFIHTDVQRVTGRLT